MLSVGQVHLCEDPLVCDTCEYIIYWTVLCCGYNTVARQYRSCQQEVLHPGTAALTSIQ